MGKQCISQYSICKDTFLLATEHYSVPGNNDVNDVSKCVVVFSLFHPITYVP